MTTEPTGTHPSRICAICGQPGSGLEFADCANCGRWFHVPLVRDSAAPACGAATSGQACGFSFTCNDCIATMERAAAAGGPWRSVLR